jgi:hypothetical protein
MNETAEEIARKACLITVGEAERLAIQYAGWQSSVLGTGLDDTAGIIVWGEALLETLLRTGSTIADPSTVTLTVRLAKEREAAATRLAAES